MNPDDALDRKLTESLSQQLAREVEKDLTASVDKQIFQNIENYNGLKDYLTDLKKQMANMQEDTAKYLCLTDPISTPTKLTSGGVYAPPNASTTQPKTPTNIWTSLNVNQPTLQFKPSKLTPQYYTTYPSYQYKRDPNDPQVVYTLVDKSGATVFQIWDDGMVRGDQFEAAKIFYNTLEFEGKTLHHKIDELEHQLAFAKSALRTINDTLTADDTSPKAKHIKITAEKTLDLLKK